MSTPSLSVTSETSSSQPSPQMESCCCLLISTGARFRRVFATYSNLHTLTANKLHGAHDVLLHLHELRELLCKVRAERARVHRLAELVAWSSGQSLSGLVASFGHAHQCCCGQRACPPSSRTTKAEGSESATPWGRATGA